MYILALEIQDLFCNSAFLSWYQCCEFAGYILSIKGLCYMKNGSGCIRQALANFFCKGPESKQWRLWAICSLSQLLSISTEVLRQLWTVCKLMSVIVFWWNFMYKNRKLLALDFSYNLLVSGLRYSEQIFCYAFRESYVDIFLFPKMIP